MLVSSRISVITLPVTSKSSSNFLSSMDGTTLSEDTEPATIMEIHHMFMNPRENYFPAPRRVRPCFGRPRRRSTLPQTISNIRVGSACVRWN